MERQLWGFSFFTWPRYQMIMWISGWDCSNISYNSAKIGGHRYCVSVDINFFHLLCDNKIKSSCDFEDCVSPLQNTTLRSLVAIDIAKVQIKVFTFETWPHDQKVTGLGMWGLPMVSYLLPSLMAVGIAEVPT